MNSKRIILALALPLCLTAAAQDTGGYENFRKQVLSDYGQFRRQVLDDYAQFLDKAWKDYETFRGKARFPDKPLHAPEAPNSDTTPFADVPSPQQPQPKPQPDTYVPPTPPVVSPSQPTISFKFYTATVRAASLTLPRLASTNEHDVSKLWSSLQNDNVYRTAKPYIELLRTGLRLNDWLTVVLIRKYSDAIYKDDSNSSILLSQYLLANMGYNVRLGRGRERLLLLVAFRQEVFDRPYVEVDGSRYYVFGKDTGLYNGEGFGAISTCELPKNSSLGKAVNLVLENPALPSGLPNGSSGNFNVTDGTISVKGSVADMPLSVATDYPQTDVPVYATSCLSQSFRKNILEQIAPQIAGLSEKDAVDRLLHFVQYAFKYKTDTDQFGYEKPFFVEENFLYPYNDCEDRAVLFAFLVRNLLHLDVHLLYYPNHEATAVKFTDKNLRGDGYIYKDGSRYLICDPTFLGATAGMCMPQYEGTSPQVELW